MPRELRISATVSLPEGVFDEAAVLSAAKPVVDGFSDEIRKLGGVVEIEVVVPKPRGAKDAPVLPLIGDGRSVAAIVAAA
jgi:hypothetical protein